MDLLQVFCACLVLASAAPQRWRRNLSNGHGTQSHLFNNQEPQQPSRTYLPPTQTDFSTPIQQPVDTSIQQPADIQLHTQTLASQQSSGTPSAVYSAPAADSQPIQVVDTQTEETKSQPDVSELYSPPSEQPGVSEIYSPPSEQPGVSEIYSPPSEQPSVSTLYSPPSEEPGESLEGENAVFVSTEVQGSHVGEALPPSDKDSSFSSQQVQQTEHDVPSNTYIAPSENEGQGEESSQFQETDSVIAEDHSTQISNIYEAPSDFQNVGIAISESTIQHQEETGAISGPTQIYNAPDSTNVFTGSESQSTNEQSGSSGSAIPSSDQSIINSLTNEANTHAEQQTLVSTSDLSISDLPATQEEVQSSLSCPDGQKISADGTCLQDDKRVSARYYLYEIPKPPQQTPIPPPQTENSDRIHYNVVLLRLPALQGPQVQYIRAPKTEQKTAIYLVHDKSEEQDTPPLPPIPEESIPEPPKLFYSPPSQSAQQEQGVASDLGSSVDASEGTHSQENNVQQAATGYNYNEPSS